MIVLTRLKGSRFALNPDLVERIHQNPDTTIVMVDGSSFIVTESLEEVVRLVVDFRADVLARARAITEGLDPDPVPAAAALTLAPKAR